MVLGLSQFVFLVDNKPVQPGNWDIEVATSVVYTEIVATGSQVIHTDDRLKLFEDNFAGNTAEDCRESLVVLREQDTQVDFP